MQVCVTSVGGSWIYPWKAYLKDETLPVGKEEDKGMKYMSPWYILRNEKLYKSGISTRLLKCLNEEDAATAVGP